MPVCNLKSVLIPFNSLIWWIFFMGANVELPSIPKADLESVPHTLSCFIFSPTDLAYLSQIRKAKVYPSAEDTVM